jgi:uncharacterized alkaline shock family protein YloU
MPPQGNVTVAPQVLTELISITARQVPGVIRLGSVPPWSMSYRRTHSTDTGVRVQVIDSAVVADCYLIAAPDINLLELGIAVQATVSTVIRDLVGLIVREVNVYVQDVEVGHG